MSVISGIMGAQAAGKQADAMEGQGAAAQLMARIADQQWQRFKDVFAPFENDLLKESKLPAQKQPGYLRMMGDINDRYGSAEANVRRTLGGQYQYGSPMGKGAMRSMELNRTQDLNRLESDWNSKRFGNMMSVANLGRGLPGNAMQGLSGSSAGYGNLANMYGGLASNAFHSGGQNMSNLMQLYQLWKGGGWGGTGAATADAGHYGTGMFGLGD